MTDEGGYCSSCNTVWASPGICRCDPLLNKHETAISVYEREIWNAAIEAAMKRLTIVSGIVFANIIKDLKK